MPLIVLIIVLCVIAMIFAASAPFYLKILRITEGMRSEKHQAEVNHLNAMTERERLEAEVLTLKIKEMQGGHKAA